MNVALVILVCGNFSRASPDNSAIARLDLID
jgi:hypothetical protein